MNIYNPAPAPDAPPRNRPHWLVVTRRSCALAQRVAATLRETGGAVTLATTRNELVAALWNKHNPPSHTALLQNRPGELPAGLPAWLRAGRPWMEMLSIAGSWCEGELRTGKPWDQGSCKGVPRIYWHELGSWLRREFGSSRTQHLQPTARPPLVLLDSADFETASAFSHALGDEGVRVLWQSRFKAPVSCTSVDAGLWVGGQLNGLRADRLREFTARMQSSGAPTLALLDFPRLDEARLAEQIGVDKVFGKPWSAEDLAQEAHRLCAPPRSKPAEFDQSTIRRAA